jgi:hypothetical protein
MNLDKRHELADKAWACIRELLNAYPDKDLGWYIGVDASRVLVELIEQKTARKESEASE